MTADLDQSPLKLSKEELLRYSRHLLIPDIGLSGQMKLKSSSVLVVGMGGLGSPVAMYLAAAGVGRIGLVDADHVEFSNLQRQVIHGTSHLGEPKVESARDRLWDINHDIEIETYGEWLTSHNAMNIARGYDVIVDGTDNFPTRYLTNDLCVFLGIPNVYGAIYRFDGQVSVFDAKNGPCYRCLFPDPPPPMSVTSCAEGGVMGILPGTIGTLQATEALKLLLGIGIPLTGKLMIYNALDLSFQTINLKKNPNCKVCGPQPEVTELIDYEAFCGMAGHTPDRGSAGGRYDITPTRLNERITQGDAPRMIDVREPHEFEISCLDGVESIPLGDLPIWMNDQDRKMELVLICREGVRSSRALMILTGAGFENVLNLTGGMNAWSRDVDPTVQQY